MAVTATSRSTPAAALRSGPDRTAGIRGDELNIPSLSRRPLLQIKSTDPMISLANIASVIVGKQRSTQTRYSPGRW